MSKATFVAGIFLIPILAGCGSKTVPVRAMPRTAPAAASTSTPVSEAPPALLRTPYAATLSTNFGDIRFVFYGDAPNATANFVDLAVGTKTWTDPGSSQPVQRPFYDSTVIHRVLPDLLIQGGMPLVSASTTTVAGPGYQFEDERSASRKFDKPGLVAMASRGPDSNGSQFFITLAPLPWLNGKHVVFGEVAGGLKVVREISNLPRDSDDRPLQPVVIRKVSIEYR